MGNITVYLADWQVLFREGIHFTLSGEEDIEVIGETTSNEEALSFIETNAPRVAVLNANREKLSGIAITRRIKQNVPSVSIILVVDEESEELFFSAIKSGACACITKDINPEKLLSIIREVAQGGQPISGKLLQPGLALRALDEFESHTLISPQVDNLLARLTPREAEILSRISEGTSLEEVASNMTLDEDTIRHHLDTATSKLVTNDHSRQLIESVHDSRTALGAKDQLLENPEIEYVTKDEFTVFKDNVKKTLESLFG